MAAGPTHETDEPSVIGVTSQVLEPAVGEVEEGERVHGALLSSRG